MKNLTKSITALALLVPGVAVADDHSLVLGEYGLGATIGGGFAGFIDSGTRDYVQEGGIWEGRLGFNTRGVVGFEAAYIGSAYEIDALGLDTAAVMLGTGVEGNVRLNFFEGALQPYAIVGAGWTRYDITNASANTSDVSGTDNLVSIPMGAGVGYRAGRMLLDLRGTYRVTSEHDMLGTSPNNSLDTWSATFKAGFEF
jgi:hypothetical protein